MATAADTSEDDIRRLNRQSAKLEAETRKLMAKAGKLSAEQLRSSAERSELDRGLLPSPWLFVVQRTLAAAAIMGAGAALARIFLS